MQDGSSEPDQPTGTKPGGWWQRRRRLQSGLQVLPRQGTGGPLVNLSGQVVGIDVGGAGGGLHAKGFAIPVNRALTVAKELQSRAAH